MLSKPISSNPAISGQRICKISIEINDDRTILKGETIYVDAQGNDIVDAVRRPFEFNTDGNMVDGTTGMPAVMIRVPILDSEGEPTGETNPERPEGTMTEMDFLRTLPAYGFIEQLVHAKIDMLDMMGKFN